MIGYIIISVFILIIILFVYREYKKEKEYQEERHQKRQGNKEKGSIEEPAYTHEHIPTQKELKEKETVEKKPEPELIPEPIVTKKIDLPEANYPKFNHSRLLDMGLSQEDAKEFVQELIPQIETQIPLIKKAIVISDFQGMEELTHSIKGSSTTVGTGGVSDLLVDFNTYLKTGTEVIIAEAYLEHLKHYCEELKKQYTK